MPRLPREIARRIHDKQPDEIGEEGILTRIELPNPGNVGETQPHYAKQWYDNKDKQTPHTSHPEKKGELLSPYMHKKKYFESQLIHRILPDKTIRIEMSYDPRVTRDGSFVHSTDMPVTITKEVNADEKGKAQRDSIVMPFYAALRKEMDQLRTHDNRVKTGEYSSALEKQVDDVDKNMRQIFGLSEYTIEKVPHGGLSTSELETVIKEIEEQNPSSPLLDFLRAGILPCHPEFNFIPTEPQQSDGTTDGKFIEVLVINKQALTEAAKAEAKTTEEEKKIQAIADRYVVYELLDNLYESTLTTDNSWWRYPNYEEDITTFTQEIQKALYPLIKSGDLNVYLNPKIRLVLPFGTGKYTSFEKQIQYCLIRKWTERQPVQDKKKTFQQICNQTIEEIKRDITFFKKGRGHLRAVYGI